jgi:ABC-type sugar transport system permease subunit
MSVQAKKTVKARKASFLTLERKNSLFGYVFCLPIIIGLAIMYIPVLVQSIIYSFSEIEIVKGKGFQTTFIGWENYRQALFVEEGFLRTVIESVTALIPQIFVIIIFAFFMANVLNQKFLGRTVARVIFFIPVIISTGIMREFDEMSSMLDTYNSGEKLEVGGASASGAANIFNYNQLREVISSALNNPTLSGIVLGAIDGLYSVITSSGVQMLVFLSGLQGISISMYEAAKVEGATGWEVFWKISFPMISPLILVNLIYTVIDLFLKSDNAAILYINTYMSNAATYELASALSWVYTLVVLAFVGIAWVLVKKLVVYQD